MLNKVLNRVAIATCTVAMIMVTGKIVEFCLLLWRC